VLVNANRYTLDARTWQYIEDISVNPSSQSSYPYDFAYFAGTMRFYPIPNQIVPVTLMANQKLTPLLNGADTNVWTQDAFDLIRSEAKYILANEVLHDDEMTERTLKAIYGGSGVEGYLYILRAETARRGGGGRIRATAF